MHLAIFDFDGTVTTKNSFADFILRTHGVLGALRGLLVLAPALMAYVLGLMPNWMAKQKVFAYFYRGWERERFETAAGDYAQKKLPAILRPAALERLEWHKEQGHRIVIVSAAFENYLKPWCDIRGLDLLATQVEIKEGRITGEFLSGNCYGEEKLVRIKQAYNLSDFEFIYAYGDSEGDKVLAKIADEFQYKPFRQVIRTV